MISLCSSQLKVQLQLSYFAQNFVYLVNPLQLDSETSTRGTTPWGVSVGYVPNGITAVMPPFPAQPVSSHSTDWLSSQQVHLARPRQIYGDQNNQQPRPLYTQILQSQFDAGSSSLQRQPVYDESLESTSVVYPQGPPQFRQVLVCNPLCQLEQIKDEHLHTPPLLEQAEFPHHHRQTLQHANNQARIWEQLFLRTTTQEEVLRFIDLGCRLCGRREAHEPTLLGCFHTVCLACARPTSAEPPYGERATAIPCPVTSCGTVTPISDLLPHLLAEDVLSRCEIHLDEQASWRCPYCETATRMCHQCSVNHACDQQPVQRFRIALPSGRGIISVAVCTLHNIQADRVCVLCAVLVCEQCEQEGAYNWHYQHRDSIKALDSIVERVDGQLRDLEGSVVAAVCWVDGGARGAAGGGARAWLRGELVRLAGLFHPLVRERWVARMVLTSSRQNPVQETSMKLVAQAVNHKRTLIQRLDEIERQLSSSALRFVNSTSFYGVIGDARPMFNGTYSMQDDTRPTNAGLQNFCGNFITRPESEMAFPPSDNYTITSSDKNRMNHSPAFQIMSSDSIPQHGISLNLASPDFGPLSAAIPFQGNRPDLLFNALHGRDASSSGSSLTSPVNAVQDVENSYYPAGLELQQQVGGAMVDQSAWLSGAIMAESERRFENNSASMECVTGSNACQQSTEMWTPTNNTEQQLYNDVIIPANNNPSGFPLAANIAQLRQPLEFIAEVGQSGSRSGQFNEPNGIVWDDEGILVADTNNNRIQCCLRADAWSWSTLVGEGQGGHGGDGAPLRYPVGLAALRPPSSLIVVIERSPGFCVKLFGRDGVFVRTLSRARMRGLRGVTCDLQGRVIVLQSKDEKVVTVFDESLRGAVTSRFSCDTVDFPRCIAADTHDRLYIADNTRHRICVFSYSGDPLGALGGEGVTDFPVHVHVSAAGNVVVVDNHRRFKVTVLASGGEFLYGYQHHRCLQKVLDVGVNGKGGVAVACEDREGEGASKYVVYLMRL